jgi:hypothetical protein
MPSKPAAKKETSATETKRPARNAAPRVSTAKHRTTKTQEMPSGIETGTESSQEAIAAIAYGYWESRGYQGGDPMADWVRAEAEYYGSKTAAVAA